MTVGGEKGATAPDPNELKAEMARLLAAPQFVRAPVMRRLLEFLVGQTLDGNGNRLKAYTIAVDALGRDTDFDAKQDSYPRVQVGRLRKLLDDFYDAYGSENGLRIRIPKGAYAVNFATAEKCTETGAQPAPAVMPTASPNPRRADWMRMAVVAIVSAVIATGAWHIAYMSAGADTMAVAAR